MRRVHSGWRYLQAAWPSFAFACEGSGLVILKSCCLPLQLTTLALTLEAANLDVLQLAQFSKLRSLALRFPRRWLGFQVWPSWTSLHALKIDFTWTALISNKFANVWPDLPALKTLSLRATDSGMHSSVLRTTPAQYSRVRKSFFKLATSALSVSFSLVEVALVHNGQGEPCADEDLTMDLLATRHSVLDSLVWMPHPKHKKYPAIQCTALTLGDLEVSLDAILRDATDPRPELLEAMCVKHLRLKSCVAMLWKSSIRFPPALESLKVRRYDVHAFCFSMDVLRHCGSSLREIDFGDAILYSGLEVLRDCPRLEIVRLRLVCKSRVLGYGYEAQDVGSLLRLALSGLIMCRSCSCVVCRLEGRFPLLAESMALSMCQTLRFEYLCKEEVFNLQDFVKTHHSRYLRRAVFTTKTLAEFVVDY